MTKIASYVFRVKTLDLPEDVLRFVHKDDGSIYVFSYEDKGKSYLLKKRDIDAKGNEIFLEFSLKKSLIRDIEVLL